MATNDNKRVIRERLEAAADLKSAVANATEESEIPEEYRWESTDDDVSDERRGVGRDHPTT